MKSKINKAPAVHDSAEAWATSLVYFIKMQFDASQRWNLGAVNSVVGVSVYFASCSAEDQEVSWACCSSLGLHHGVWQTSEWRGAVVQLVIWWCLCKRLFLSVLHILIFFPGNYRMSEGTQAPKSLKWLSPSLNRGLFPGPCINQLFLLIFRQSELVSLG